MDEGSRLGRAHLFFWGVGMEFSFLNEGEFDQDGGKTWG